MTRTLVVALALLGACASGPTLFRGTQGSGPEAADALYWNAVGHLDASNTQGSTDSAITFLDAYLANGVSQKHRSEALTLRRLARDAQQLARVEAAMERMKASADSRPSPDGKPRSDSDMKGRDEELLREIQRLKDELAKANEELERIRKRLAAPKPPSR